MVVAFIPIAEAENENENAGQRNCIAEALGIYTPSQSDLTYRKTLHCHTTQSQKPYAQVCANTCPHADTAPSAILVKQLEFDCKPAKQ